MHVFLAPEHVSASPVVVHLLPGVASRSLLEFVRANRLGRERAVRLPARTSLGELRRWFDRWWHDHTGPLPPSVRCVAAYEAGPLVAAAPGAARAVALVRDPVELAVRLADLHGAPPTSWSNPQARALLAGHVDDVDALPADADHPDAASWRRRLATLVATRYLLGDCRRVAESMLRFAHELGWPVSVALPVGRSGGEPVALERRLAREIERACWLDRELAAVAAADVDHFVVDELPERQRAERASTASKIKLRGPGPGTPAPLRYRVTGAPEEAEGLLERLRVAEARADWSAARVAALERQAKDASASEPATRNGNGAERPDHKVMHGRDGWLFVARDGMDVADQLTGRHVLSGRQVEVWLKTLRKREAAVRKRGAAYVFAVAPLTHHVFPEHLPPGLEPASPRPVEKLAAAMAADGDGLPPLVYPLEALRGARAHGRATSSRVDSHWNDWGAFLAYREVMAALPPGVSTRCLEDRDLVLREAVVVGDLGARVEPPMSAETVIAELPGVSIEVVEDNCVHNSGRIVRFHTPDAPDACCVLVGSSSAQVALKFFAASFRTVVYAFVRSEFDAELVKEFRPDVAISLINERFLILPADDREAPGLRATARLRAAEGFGVSEERAAKLYAGWATPQPECFVAPG